MPLMNAANNSAPKLSRPALMSLRSEAKVLGWDWVAEICTQALDGSEPHLREASRLAYEWACT